MLSYDVRKRALLPKEEEASMDEAAKRRRHRENAPRSLEKRAAGAAARRRGASVALRLRESALFRPVRAIGVVSDGLPFAPVTLGSADFFTVSVGRGFQVFECEKLRLAYLSPRLNERVQALLNVGQVNLTSLGLDIVAWHKLVELGRFRGHTAPPTVLCAIGAGYLVSAAGGEVLVWKLSQLGLEADEAEQQGNHRRGDGIVAPLGKIEWLAESEGECTAICHPPTYLNKVLVAGSKGGLSLHNVRTLERLYSFKSHLSESEEFSITCLREAPNVLDVVAVGFSSGRIVLLNAKEDRCVLRLEQAQGRVTCLSFRSGINAPAHLASGSRNGAIVVWDLEKKKCHHVIDDAHQGPVTAAHFLPGQPRLLTLGLDNAVREWIFDTVAAVPRLHRYRSGCPGPARKMFFYTKDDDRQLIVAGTAENGGGFVARVSCTAQHQNEAFAQSNSKKLPQTVKLMLPGLTPMLGPVIDLAFCEVRHYDWPAVVTAHVNTDAAFIWSASHQALAPLLLRPNEEKDRAPVSAVAISTCGNYVVTGLENGALHRFNLQSQLHRGPIPRPEEKSTMALVAASLLDSDSAGDKKKEGGEELKGLIPGAGGGTRIRGRPSKDQRPLRAHAGRVCGVAITSSGVVISAGSHPADCALRLWKLSSHEALDVIPLGPGRSTDGPSPLLLRMHGALVAVSLSDGQLLIADLLGKTVVRSFSCGVPAIDVSFSAEGRWLAASLRGGGLRVFDLPSARCVDSLAFARPALAVCFSPTTTYLLTSHAKGNAIQMWANKFLFDPSLSAPLLQPELAEPVRIDDSGVPGADEDSSGEEEQEAEATHSTPSGLCEGAATDATPLAKDLLTLSDVPPAKCLSILHLDIVKERNKPVEPPKPLPNAPFFLPTSHEGVTARFAVPTGDQSVEGRHEEEPKSRILHSLDKKRGPLGALAVGSKFQMLLCKGDFDGALAFLKKQTPSGVHLAIEELGPLAGGDLNDLAAGLEFFAHHLQQAHYADEIQVYMSLFLQAHGEEVAGAAELRASCAQLLRRQEQRWSALDEQCQKTKCFLGMMTHTQSQW